MQKLSEVRQLKLPHTKTARERASPKPLKSLDFFWLRGLDLNQRPLGYERPEISVSIGQQGTSGNPEIPLGTAGTAHWGPYGDAFGHCPTMCPTISPNGVVLVSVEFTFDQ